MHSLGLIMACAVMFSAISNGRIAADTTAPPETVRLVGGSRSSEGRVEVFLDGQWGTVCNNLWTLREANVVCRQLGYIGADMILYAIGNKFAEGVGDILLDMVRCEGSEEDLLNCQRGVIADTQCDHSEDVGVECTTRNSLRLADGASYRQGRLEMLDETGQWGTVCAQDWDLEDTRVACSQLGRFLPAVSNDVDWYRAAPGSGPVVTGGLQCTGSEDRLDNCTQTTAWTPTSCDQSGHGQDIGVICGPNVVLYLDGLIAVFNGRAVGTICPGDNWDQNAAGVACRSLGHKGVKESRIVNYGILQVILNNPRCSGNETFYTECESAEWAYQGDCAPGSGRAAVICELEEPQIEIRSDSLYPEIGEVEISLTDPSEFMAICNSTWDIAKAHLVCRQLGHSGGAAQIFSSSLDDGSDHVITDLECSDGAASLANCTFETMEVGSEENCDLVAGVACLTSAENSLVPLVSGGSTSEGVLEYKIAGLPALICDPDWSDREATVTCRMHGYEMGTVAQVVSLGHSKASFPYSFQNYNITCSGSEASLAECQMESIEDIDECSSDDVVQVTCQPNRDWDLRLVGSTVSEQGRVEVFLGGQWGSFLFTGNRRRSFRDDLCQNLGYERYIEETFDVDEDPFEAGTGKVLKCDNPFPDGCEKVQTVLSEDETRDDTSVVCLPKETVENHPVRLVSERGLANNETGRVEILHDGEWGAVCDSGHSIYQSVHLVVCRELGYTDMQYAQILTGADQRPFLTGNDKIWFVTYRCATSRLYMCDHEPWGQRPDDCTPSVVTCVPDDSPGLHQAHQTGLIAGSVLMVLLIIAV